VTPAPAPSPAAGRREMKLTTRQVTVLRTLRAWGKMTADDIGVRSDVLWRLEHAGLVARDSNLGRGREKWFIYPAGREALDNLCPTCWTGLQWPDPAMAHCPHCGSEWPAEAATS
jgi:hypothetical protein